MSWVGWGVTHQSGVYWNVSVSVFFYGRDGEEGIYKFKFQIILPKLYKHILTNIDIDIDPTWNMIFRSQSLAKIWKDMFDKHKQC